MRLLAILVAALLLAGCSAPGGLDGDADGAPHPTGDVEPGRQARGGGTDDEGDDNQTEASLGSQSGGATEPGTYPFKVVVPPGGAHEVAWSLEVVPAAAPMLDGVTGPGCQTYGWHSGGTQSGTSGVCADLPEGETELAFVLNVPVTSYTVEVWGTVWTDASSNATER